MFTTKEVEAIRHRVAHVVKITAPDKAAQQGLQLFALFVLQTRPLHKAIVDRDDLDLLGAQAANRDPAMFPEPQNFDPERDNSNRHVAFGRGGHICLGQFLARNQLQEGLHLIAQRLKNPRSNGPIAWRPFLGAWGPKTLPIAFDAG